MAQSVYREGDLLETEDAVTSQNVLLYSQGRLGTGFLNGTGSYGQTISMTWTYRFESTGETIEGHNIYRIKQMYTGLYVKDYQLDLSKGEESSNDASIGTFSSGDFIDMTSSADEALKVTVTIAKEDSSDPYAGAINANGMQDLSYTAFVIRRAELVDGEVQYFGHYYTPFHSIYKDTNAWHIYAEPTGRYKVLAFIRAYYGESNTDPAITYPAGINPGAYKAEFVNPAHQAWQAASDAIKRDENNPLTDEQANEICERVESTVKALQTREAYNPLTPGYYFIKSTAGRYLYGASQATNDFVYAGKAGEDVNTSAVTIDNLKYLWRVGDFPADSLYAIQNVVYGKSLGGESVKADPAGNSHYGFTISNLAQIIVSKGVAKANDGKVIDPTVFNLISLTKDGGNGCIGYHAKYDNRPLEGWNERTSINNCYTFTPVETDEAEIATLVAQDWQNKLNDVLSASIAIANDFYKEGYDYYKDAIQQDPESYSHLGDEISKATAELEVGKATQKQIDDLNNAIERFKSLLPIPSRVIEAYDAAKAFFDAAKDNGLIGTNLAQFSQHTADALQSVLTKYENFNKIDIESIIEAVDEINTAFVAFKSSLRLPKAGKYYTIKSASKKVAPASYKWLYGYEGTAYNAIVYSASNNSAISPSAADNAVRFTFANHSSEVTLDGETTIDAMIPCLTDSVSLTEDASYVWKVETAQDGKVVLRNLATGMYITGANGKLYQSIEPTSILVEGVRANAFRFNLGANDVGITQYMRINGIEGTIVPWRYADDENSYWQFNELAEEDFTTHSFAIKGVKEGQFYAATFPVAVNSDEFAIIYTVLGVNEAKDKLVLAEADEVPAGTPVILLADIVVSIDGSTVGSLVVGCEDLSSADYVFEAQENNGLLGTICEPVEINEAFGHFVNGKVVTGAYTVPCNGAYLAYATVTSAKGDATVELSKDFGGILTSIDSDKVVVLPSVVNVYDVNGQLVRKNVKAVNAKKDLPAGVYVIGGQKVVVK